VNDVTRILNDDDPNAADRLLPIVYDELRELAAARMANEKPGQTLAPTGLVHEAWLRLAGADAEWESRGHFFAAAAEAMRRILIERARRKKAVKHGGEHRRAEFDLDSIEAADPDERLLQLDEALAQLTEIEPTKAQLVKLRYFAGCSTKEAAEILGISTATADRYWAYSRAWLQTEMQSGRE
jgi:RNA polymerase sigma factor (TIGR02999 family)